MSAAKDEFPSELNAELREIALESLRAYLNASPMKDGRTPVEVERETDERRICLIDTALRPLLESYLAGHLPVTEFKRRVDGVNKQNQLWGFGGIKGQMFFNVLLKTAEEQGECDSQLRVAVRAPRMMKWQRRN